MQCFPLLSILTALDSPTVNLFILDIEGYELAVLRALPWDKLDIEVDSIFFLPFDITYVRPKISTLKSFI